MLYQSIMWNLLIGILCLFKYDYLQEIAQMTTASKINVGDTLYNIKKKKNCNGILPLPTINRYEIENYLCS